MARPKKYEMVKDFDEQCKEGDYVVIHDGCIIYDNRIGSESDYYKVYAKPIDRVVQGKHVWKVYV